VRFARVRRTDEVLERARFGGEALEVETQADLRVDLVVEPAILERLKRLDHAAARVLERAEE
jgi:hypothetical protein